MNNHFRFVTAKDPHYNFGFRDNIRFNRNEQVKEKMKFKKDYMHKNNINDLFYTGDVFDSNEIEKWSFKKYLETKKEFEKFSKGIDIWSNMGNHDFFYGFEDSTETIFEEMVDQGYLNYLKNKPFIKELDGAKIMIFGIDYSHDKENIIGQLKNIDDHIESDEPIYKIVIFHSNITVQENEFTDFTYNWLLEKFNTIDMFICGHYHLGYDTFIDLNSVMRKVTIINNWNFTRVVRDYETQYDLHTPEFSDITINFNKETQSFESVVKVIKVPFVSYERAFKTKLVDLIKETTSSPKDGKFSFFNEIDLTKLTELGLDKDDKLLEHIGKEKKYNERIIQKALSYLNEVDL